MIDTLESHEAAQEALVDIKKVINDKPIDAIILTHFHADHTGEFFDHKLCSRGLTSNMKTLAEIFYGANNIDRQLSRQKIRQKFSVIITNTCVFSVFKTKCELKCQNELFF